MQDKTSVRSLLYYLFVIWLAKKLGKKVFIWSQGIGPIRKSISCFFAMKLLKKIDAITVRDNASIEILKKLGVSNQIVAFSADPVFLLKIKKYRARRIAIGCPQRAGSPRKGGRLTIGFTLRTFPGKIETTLIVNVVNAINKLPSNCNILFLCCQPPADMKFIQKVRALLSRKSQIIILSSVETVLEPIKDLDLMVSMRLHPLILAAKTQVKFIGICVDQKIKELMEQLHYQDNLIEWPIKADNLFQKINFVLDNGKPAVLPLKLIHSAENSILCFKELLMST